MIQNPQKRDKFKHLHINRTIPPDPKRIRRGRTPPLVTRNNLNHGRTLGKQFSTITGERRNRDYPSEINPELIFIIEEIDNQQNILDKEFESANLTPLFRNSRGKYVLFASDGEAIAFLERLDVYRNWTLDNCRRNNQINPDYAQLYSRIENIRSIQPNDRKGNSLQKALLDEEIDNFVIHVNFWWLGDARMKSFSNEMHNFANSNSFTILYEFFNFRTANMVMAVNRDNLEKILEIDQVYMVNLIQNSDSTRIDISKFTIEDFDTIDIQPPAQNAPFICLIDTGITKEHPLIQKSVIEEKKFGLSEYQKLIRKCSHQNVNCCLRKFQENS